MDIVKIQSLIAQGRVVSIADIDPAQNSIYSDIFVLNKIY